MWNARVAKFHKEDINFSSPSLGPLSRVPLLVLTLPSCVCVCVCVCACACVCVCVCVCVKGQVSACRSLVGCKYLSIYLSNNLPIHAVTRLQYTPLPVSNSIVTYIPFTATHSFLQFNYSFKSHFIPISPCNKMNRLREVR